METFLLPMLKMIPLPALRRTMPRFPRFFSPIHWLYSALEMVRVIRFKTDCPQTEHYPRSWLILEEARRRGLVVEHLHILGKPSTEYRVYFGSRRFYFDILPTRVIHDQLDDKAFVKKKLKRAGFPVPEGRAFWSRRHGRAYARDLKFPVAVKPTNGTRSQHVTAPVENENALQEAVNRAARYGGRFMVEHYLPGELYRVTVVNQAQVFATHRLAPHVIGDGRHTVAELIKQKNQDPRRGNTDAKHHTLHRIAINDATVGALTVQRLTLDAIPPAAQWVLLYHKRSCGAGGDLIERTPELHPETREMFRHAARVFGVDLVGFDFIAEDLGRSYRQQRCGIIEANSLPFIDFHAAPSQGQPQPIAQALWDSVLVDPRAHIGNVVLRSWSHTFMNVALRLIVPPVRWLLTSVKIVDTSRQPFLIGKLCSIEMAAHMIAQLKIEGFEHIHLAWEDAGQVATLRKLLNDERQLHLRIFEDGEVRGHVEYAPESRPFDHLLERHFVPPEASLIAPLQFYLTIPVASSAVRDTIETAAAAQEAGVVKC